MASDEKKRNIAVAVDFSKNSDYAILRAVNIAKEKNANLILLHVVQKKSLDNFLDSTLKSLLPKRLWLTTEEYKETLIQEKLLKLANQKINVNYVVIRTGKPAIKILQYAKKNKIDLLIMGAHGYYSIRDSFVGTTTEYVAKKTQCPVLVVKNPPLNKYRKILVPTDFSKVSKKALNYAIKLLPGSNIHLFHVGDYEFENLLKREKKEIPKYKFTKIHKAISLYLENKMKKFIKGCKLGKHPYNISLGYPGPLIIKEAEKSNQDLIVMGTQGHGRIHYLFIGGVANRVLIDGNKDILLIPPKMRKSNLF